ncbi:type II secretion system protein GspM [Stutzerimonas nitrititolerans]|uniref:type II secretion system protein GspM n=1 Tax=Stutzerimonas nitrititolerans TaxID=2482751 RepID=UPI0028A2A583|nr:type II secretion system protein GspM [Stutzerimonas nitrititolerans]
MNKWLQRWQAFAPREQWLCFAVGLGLVVMLYMMLVADPLAARIAAEQNRQRLAESRQLEADSTLREIQAKLAADPNLTYRQALQSAQADRTRILQRIDEETRALIAPVKMKALLQDVLRTQDKLKLIELESSSTPLTLPGNVQTDAEQRKTAPLTFYRHGLRLTLEGGYFELLTYLNAIQASGWRLHWDSLDYEVGEAGAGRARIILDLHTLSRDAGWVGV